MSYEQGQVSTNLFQDVDDATKWILPINTKPSVPEYIGRETHYDRDTPLQYDAISNRHVPQTPLSVHDAIPLFIPAAQRVRGPFTFEEPKLQTPGRIGQIKSVTFAERDSQMTEVIRYHEGFDKTALLQIARTVIEERHEQYIMAAQAFANYHPQLLKHLRGWVDSAQYSHQALIQLLRKSAQELFRAEKIDYGSEDVHFLVDTLIKYEKQLSSPFEERRRAVLPKVVDELYNLFNHLEGKISRSNAFTVLALLPPLPNEIPFATTLHERLNDLIRYPRAQPELAEQRDHAEAAAEEEEQQQNLEEQATRLRDEAQGYRDDEKKLEDPENIQPRAGDKRQRTHEGAPHADVQEEHIDINLPGEPDSALNKKAYEEIQDELRNGVQNNDNQWLSGPFVRRAQREMLDLIHHEDGISRFGVIRDHAQHEKDKDDMSESEHTIYNLYQGRTREYLSYVIQGAFDEDNPKLSFKDFTNGQGTRFEQGLIDSADLLYRDLNRATDDTWSNNFHNHLRVHIMGDLSSPTTLLIGDELDEFNQIINDHKQLKAFQKTKKGSVRDFSLQVDMHPMHEQYVEFRDQDKAEAEVVKSFEAQRRKRMKRDLTANYKAVEQFVKEEKMFNDDEWDYLDKSLSMEQVPQLDPLARRKVDEYIHAVQTGMDLMEEAGTDTLTSNMGKKVQRAFKLNDAQMKVVRNTSEYYFQFLG